MNKYNVYSFVGVSNQGIAPDNTGVGYEVRYNLKRSEIATLDEALSYASEIAQGKSPHGQTTLDIRQGAQGATISIAVGNTDFRPLELLGRKLSLPAAIIKDSRNGSHIVERYAMQVMVESVDG